MSPAQLEALGHDDLRVSKASNYVYPIGYNREAKHSREKCWTSAFLTYSKVGSLTIKLWIGSLRLLHQSHADEKRFREDAIIRLQEEQSKIQNRLDRLYDDRLDGCGFGH